MNREARELHARLAQVPLPEGWTCEKAWPWQEHTHFVAPGRKGGVIVKQRHLRVQLETADNLCSPTMDILDDGEFRFAGRGWRDRIVEAAKKAVSVYRIVGNTDGHRVNRTPMSWQEL